MEFEVDGDEQDIKVGTGGPVVQTTGADLDRARRLALIVSGALKPERSGCAACGLPHITRDVWSRYELDVENTQTGERSVAVVEFCPTCERTIDSDMEVLGRLGLQ
jgi:hypothetical protein